MPQPKNKKKRKAALVEDPEAAAEAADRERARDQAKRNQDRAGELAPLEVNTPDAADSVIAQACGLATYYVTAPRTVHAAIALTPFGPTSTEFVDPSMIRINSGATRVSVDPDANARHVLAHAPRESEADKEQEAAQVFPPVVRAAWRLWNQGVNNSLEDFRSLPTATEEWYGPGSVTTDRANDPWDCKRRERLARQVTRQGERNVRRTLPELQARAEMGDFEDDYALL